MTIHYFYANPIQGFLAGNKKSHPFGWLFLPDYLLLKNLIF
jgi:hypothetical protein